MALLGTLIDTRTVAAAATASAGYSHTIGLAPDIVIATPYYAAGTLTTEFPYFSATMDSASVTYFNRGKTAETYSIAAVRFHTVVR